MSNFILPSKLELPWFFVTLRYYILDILCYKTLNLIYTLCKILMIVNILSGNPPRVQVASFDFLVVFGFSVNSK